MKDQINRTLYFQHSPQRIVCLVPSLTELLVDLGLEEKIVGITKFCVHPPHLKLCKTIVGGTKNIHFEKIKNLQPDIILCNKEENTQEIVLACEKIAPTHVSNIFTIDDTIELIQQYGKIFKIQQKALKLIKNLKSEVNSFQTFAKNIQPKKVVYCIWKNPWMVAGGNTFINHLLELNKFNNVFKSISRYPEIDIENIQQEKSPDLILLSSEPYPFKEKHIIEIQNLNSSTKIILVDGEMFSWYGSRLLKAFKYFKKLHSSII